MRAALDQVVPREIPIRGRRDFDHVRERNIAHAQLDQFVVVAIAVEQENGAAAVNRHRPQQIA